MGRILSDLRTAFQKACPKSRPYVPGPVVSAGDTRDQNTAPGLLDCLAARTGHFTATTHTMCCCRDGSRARHPWPKARNEVNGFFFLGRRNLCRTYAEVLDRGSPGSLEAEAWPEGAGIDCQAAMIRKEGPGGSNPFSARGQHSRRP